MNRHYLAGAIVLALGTGMGAAAPHADAGKIVVEGVTGGRFVDPFLDGAEALVRAQGFKGEFATLVGLSGLGAEVTVCRQDCDCRETLHSAGRLQKLVAPLKGTVKRWGTGATDAKAGWAALKGELANGRPLLAEGLTGPTTLHLVYGCDDGKRMLLYLEGGDRRQIPFSDWTAGNWSFCTARLETTQLPGAKAEMEAIATMFAQARQPRIEGGCAVRIDRTQNAVGLEAYSLWSEQVHSGEPVDPETKGQRVKGLVERRQMLSKFMRTAASHQGGETAAKLREAAASVDQEVKQGLKPLAATTPVPAPAGADKKQSDPTLRKKQVGLMQVAASFQRRFLGAIEPLALQKLNVPQQARPLVTVKETKAAAGQNPEAVRKLLQATDSRVRMLGTVAAGTGGDATLAPELIASLKSADGVEARGALGALQAVRPDDLLGMLKKQADVMGEAASNMEGGTANTDAIQRQIQFAIEDLEASKPPTFLSNPLAWLWRTPTRYYVLGLLAAIAGIAAWKLLGPRRLKTTVEKYELPEIPGLPEHAARLEGLLARPPATGLLLTHLEPEGMAAKQGLELGDVIVRYNDTEIFGMEHLRGLINQTGPGKREIVARRGIRTVKTVVVPGPLGLGGVSVTRGEPFWKRLPTLPYQPDVTGLEGDGETWYRFTQGGKPCGFEWHRWRWAGGDLELSTVTGLATGSGDENVRVVQRLSVGERLTCRGTRFRARGQRAIEADAACTGGRWSVLVNGKSLTDEIPEEALPTHAMASFAATLPFAAGRAYDVVRIDECDFVPAYGYQITCAGQELIKGQSGGEQAWRFDLAEYGLRQMAFWFNERRELIRAEYAGLVGTLTSREEALADLPESIRTLAGDPGRDRAPAHAGGTGTASSVGTAVVER